MTIANIIQSLEALAPPVYQEQYDNAGLITGSRDWECTGILLTLDALERVVEEAIERRCNLIVAHHPIVFGGLKKINGSNYVERTVIKAIKNDIAIYAIHTNLDNIISGVNGKIASLLQLKNISVLDPKPATLKKLYTYVPQHYTEKVREAIFQEGGGEIGDYSECSFEVNGTGTFLAGKNSQPFVGKKGERHYEPEVKLEIIFPAFLETRLLTALRKAHPYEEVAFEVIALSNTQKQVGSGIIGDLPIATNAASFLKQIKEIFNIPVIKHTRLLEKPIEKVAVCGGAGSFLIKKAIAGSADVFITGDLKYHDYFEAEEQIIMADIGHFESEQYTIDLLEAFLQEKFPTFAVLKSKVNTNPVHYYLG